MRLVELNPKWITLSGWASPSLFAVGLLFDCPHCGARRLGVNFDVPVDPDGLRGRMFEFDAQRVAAAAGRLVWQRTGETFDTMTLNPSIDVEGHWHGSIVSGEMRPA